jgi:hypothetical protein
MEKREPKLNTFSLSIYLKKEFWNMKKGFSGFMPSSLYIDGGRDAQGK